MVKKNLLKILLISIIVIFSIQLKVQAAVITSTDKQVESNSGSVTISVASKQALGSFKLKLVDTAGLTLENTAKGSSSFEISNDKMTITGSSSDGVTNLGSFTFKIPAVSKDTTYKIKFLVSGMETTNLDAVPDENNTAVVTVKAPVTPTPEKPTTPTTPTTPATKSSEARLKTFGVTPDAYDFSGFSKNRDKEKWSTTVPNSVSEVEVYATALDKNAKVEGVGKVALKEGSNTVKVTVTAEAGNTKTYTLTIKRKTAEEETAENGEARLKNLGIKPDEYDFKGFESEKTEYSVEVPNEVEEIEVYAIAMNSSAQITGTGMIELKEGKNDLKVEVIAANGTKKTYTLEVTRKEKEGVSGTTEEVSGTAKEEIETSTLPIVNENVTEQIIQKSWLKPSTWGQEEKIKIAIIAVLIILIICAIVLKINISKENKNANKLGLPGAEELDKAMAEHQELSEEPSYTEDIGNIQKNEVKQNYIEDIAKNKFGGVEDEIDVKAKRKGRHF